MADTGKSTDESSTESGTNGRRRVRRKNMRSCETPERLELSINLRVSPEEFELLTRRATQLGMSRNRYLHKVLEPILTKLREKYRIRPELLEAQDYGQYDGTDRGILVAGAAQNEPGRFN